MCESISIFFLKANGVRGHGDPGHWPETMTRWNAKDCTEVQPDSTAQCSVMKPQQKSSAVQIHCKQIWCKIQCKYNVNTAQIQRSAVQSQLKSSAVQAVQAEYLWMEAGSGHWIFPQKSTREDFIEENLTWIEIDWIKFDRIFPQESTREDFIEAKSTWIKFDWIFPQKSTNRRISLKQNQPELK